MDIGKKALELAKIDELAKNLNQEYNEKNAKALMLRTAVIKDNDEKKAIELFVIQTKMEDIKKEIQEIIGNITKLKAELEAELKKQKEKT